MSANMYRFLVLIYPLGILGTILLCAVAVNVFSFPPAAATVLVFACFFSVPGAVIYVKIRDRIDCRRRGRFLDLLAEMSRERVLEVAEKIQFLGSVIGEDIFLPYKAKYQYPPRALGRFVESLLHARPSESNFCNIATFLLNSSRRFRKEFLAGMTRHKDVVKSLNETIEKMELNEWEAKNKERADHRFRKGLEMCGYHPPLEENGN